MVGGWREERSEDEETLVEREEGEDRPVPSYHPRYLLHILLTYKRYQTGLLTPIES